MEQPSQERSKALYERAREVIPGGVNSPVRAFRAVGGDPLFFARGEGPYLWDVDGVRYIDLVGSWGPLILGHRPPAVEKALMEAIKIGTSFGAPTEPEVLLAEMILEAFPDMEMVRMVNSGTEATMTALRLARAFTGRERVVKFEGCYHGHSDPLLIKAGSGALTLGVPTSPGVPFGLLNSTIVAQYNNLSGLEEIFSSVGSEIAAVIVEPVAANMGLVLPAPGFLEGLREITKKHGALLIFDEVITGFRIEYGGAQTRYRISPDLTCLGKIIGGGLPVGAFGGRREVMEMLAPSGPVYQAGTLSGNPLAMAAGIAMLKELKPENVYLDLASKSEYLIGGMKQAASDAGVGDMVCFAGVESLLGMFFTPGPVTDYAAATKSNIEAYARFFREMLRQGVYMAPAQFEAFFVNLALTRENLDSIIKASQSAFKEAGIVLHGG
ncbi:MAG: glutamate-1-semialdehyde 2,1-aminomutase [Firmicutes bacterium]|nr:glutamate-1-semialdehyde 2,1-aminomutase [Bacillota bacterium]